MNSYRLAKVEKSIINVYLSPSRGIHFFCFDKSSLSAYRKIHDIYTAAQPGFCIWMILLYIKICYKLLMRFKTGFIIN